MSAAPIEYLFNRRSVKFVGAPGPNDEQLAQILRAAMSAPDHGKLRPWRFKLIRGEAVTQLGDLALGAIKRAGLPLTTQKEASTREWLKNVPLLIAVACRMDTQNTKIPEDERMLATGAAASNILNAAHMLGFAAYWSTGLGTYVDEVTEALGFDSLEYRFLGYLAIGTPIALSEPPQRPDYRDFTSEWTG